MASARAKDILSPRLSLLMSAILLAALLIQAARTEAGGPSDPCASPTLTGTSTQDFAAGCIDEDGGSVKTESPATQSNPHWTKVTVPPGFPGGVTIEEHEEFPPEVDEVGAAGLAVDCDPSRGRYTCLISDIFTTQTTTRKKPMIFRFTVDKSTFPRGTRIGRIRIFHDEKRVPRCDDEDSVKIGYQLEQGQQSCHAKTVRLRNRDVRFVVLTTINGRWRFK
ncbi:MAG: hypothetical protein M3N24_06470 [Actinomycetota bacterium]|nr:hypothetical protein [Actinomycetota bacterium]